MMTLKSGQIMINLEFDVQAESNDIQDVIKLLEIVNNLSKTSILEKAKMPAKEKPGRKPRKTKDGIIVTMIPPTPPVSQHQASEYIEEELDEEI